MLPKLWGDVWAQLAGSNHRTSPASRATLPVARYHTPQNTKTAASVPLPSLTFPTPYRPTPPYLPGAISGALAMGMGAVGKP